MPRSAFKKNGQSVETQRLQNLVFVKFLLKANVFKEKPGMYVSHCPALDLYSQGDTPEEAREMIHDAVRMFIESCVERNVLNEVLADCGFFQIQGEATNTIAVDTDDGDDDKQHFTVPAEMPVLAFG